jgi:uncharacterized delta-60 repeat protein
MAVTLGSRASAALNRFRQLRVETLERRDLLSIGPLDPTFDGDGIAHNSFLQGDDRDQIARAVAVQADGKILTAGQAETRSVDTAARLGDQWWFQLARHNPDGSLDTSFGTGGVVFHDISTHSIAYGMALQPDGKIVVVAATSFSDGQYRQSVVMRFNADGSFDTGFDSDGILAVPSLSSTYDAWERMYCVTIQPDGKIVVGGTANYYFAVARYNADGSWDSTFHGAQSTWGGAAYSIAVQADGKIVAAGDASAGSFAVVRYNADGSLDASFDTDGVANTDFGSGYDQAMGLVIQDDGKIIAGGNAANGTSYNFAVARYNADGSPDPTFDADGMLTTAFAAGEAKAYAIAMQPDGKFVATGYCGTSQDIALARYNPDGSLDSGFDGDGLAVTPIGSGDDIAYAAALQPDGKLVVAGSSSNGDNLDFALARYESNGRLDASFGSAGIATAGFPISYDMAQAMTVDSEGRVLLAGSSGGDLALLRYDVDGGLDTTFDNDGQVVLSCDAATNLLQQPDGKILVTSGLNGMRRFNADGSVDPTFVGNDGRSYLVGINDVAFQPDGKILVAGYTTTYVRGFGYVHVFTVQRCNDDGSIDTTFNGSGYVRPFGNRIGAEANGIIAQPDGKIVVKGREGDHMRVARLLADGTLDQSFSGDGLIAFTDMEMLGSVYTLALQPDGKIVGAAKGYQHEVALLRFNADGSIDATFAGGTLESTTGSRTPRVAVQRDGKIVVLSVEGNLWRYNADGTLDVELENPIPGASLTSMALGPDGTIVVGGYRFEETGYQFVAARLLNDQPTLVKGVSTPLADGLYPVGTRIPITLTFTDRVTVTGSPQLVMETGTTDRVAKFVAGSGSHTLAFDYTVQEGDGNGDLDYVSSEALTANGATLVDSQGKSVLLALPIPGQMGSLSFNKDLIVDWEPPDTQVTAGPQQFAWARTATLSFTGSDAATMTGSLVFEGSLDGAEYQVVTSPTTFTGLEGGHHTFVVRARDRGGNVDPTPASYSWNVMYEESVGLLNPSSGTFYLRNSNTSGLADCTFGCGDPSQGWITLVGDWDGDHVDSVGFFDPQTCTWYLRNALTTGFADWTFGYGDPQRTAAGGERAWGPVVGDWDGDGIDTIGMFDPASSTWYLRNSLSSGFADWTFGYGDPGYTVGQGDRNWVPLAGDWNGDGTDTVGFFDPGTCTWWLRNSLSSGYAELVFRYGDPTRVADQGANNWVPLVGDWDGNRTETVGLFDPLHSTFMIRNAHTIGEADFAFGYGAPQAGWLPLVGCWRAIDDGSEQPEPNANLDAQAVDQLDLADIAAEELALVVPMV